MTQTILMSLMFTLVCSPSFAQTFVATFVMAKGDVKILRAADGSAKGPFLIYEGTKYAYEKARIGKKVMPSEILQTGADGRAKIVYGNGDHFDLGPGTSMSLPTPTGNAEKDGPSLDLFYGRVRALVTKGGPRTKMKAKTPAATAGVRGTDFFIRHNPSIGSQVSVLRGEVEVTERRAAAKSVAVKKGFTAQVKGTAKEEIQVALATKEQIMEIQKETALKPDPALLAKLPTPVQKEVKQLTQKTTEAVLTDIRTEDPKLHKELEGNDIYEINTTVVARLFQQAPGEAKTKPTAEEMEAIGKDVYEKYFKPAN